MSTINREAAIRNLTAIISKQEGKPLIHWEEVKKMLEAMPEAQPEIIRCKDCKYQSKGQNECETWNLCGYRPWQYTPTTDEHFCSYAERRTDE